MKYYVANMQNPGGESSAGYRPSLVEPSAGKSVFVSLSLYLPCLKAFLYSPEAQSRCYQNITDCFQQLFWHLILQFGLRFNLGGTQTLNDIVFSIFDKTCKLKTGTPGSTISLQPLVFQSKLVGTTFTTRSILNNL